MNRVAYSLNGALYINHLPPQKFLCINPVILKNPKGIARTGEKKPQGHTPKLLGKSRASHEDVQQQRVYAWAGWEEAGLWAVGLLHLEQRSSIPLFCHRRENYQIPLLDVCVKGP